MEKCPGLRRLPVVDEAPRPAAGERFERLPEDEWTEEANAVRVVYRCVLKTDGELAAEGETRRAAKVAAIGAERDRRLALGAAHGGKRFSLSDTSRTDLGGMATTAVLVKLGALPWPGDYARGWIALDNERLPLPTPDDGIVLAATVAGAYAGIVQRARDLKDTALKAPDPESIDITVGWPD